MAGVADGILWIHELTLVRLLDLARSTYQTWSAEGLIRRPDSGAFTKVHLVEAVICRSARLELSVNATRNGMDRLREEVLEHVVDAVREPDKMAFVDLVVNKNASSFELCLSARELTRAVRDPRGSRTCVITPLGQLLAEAMQGFENEANRGSPPSRRRRGRPPKEHSASVIPLRGG